MSAWQTQTPRYTKIACEMPPTQVSMNGRTLACNRAEGVPEVVFSWCRREGLAFGGGSVTEVGVERPMLEAVLIPRKVTMAS